MVRESVICIIWGVSLCIPDAGAGAICKRAGLSAVSFVQAIPQSCSISQKDAAPIPYAESTAENCISKNGKQFSN